MKETIDMILFALWGVAWLGAMIYAQAGSWRIKHKIEAIQEKQRWHEEETKK